MRDNIITARFRGGSSCRTAPVWQYDYGQIMQFPDLDLPQSYEVHFSLGGPAVQAIGGPDGVAVPDALLLRSGALTTYIYLHTGEADGETVYTVTTPVTPRAAISSVQPTPVQQDAITQAIAALKKADAAATRVRSINSTSLTPGGQVVEAVGIPVFVGDADLATYADYGLTVTGWYVFARVAAPDGVEVSAATAVTGASAIITPGADHLDLAIRFEVAAQTAAVAIAWAADTAETFVFKATDLAVRNLDYRTTFYIYDIAPFATWQYALTTDTAFVAGSRYFTESEGVYTEAVEGTDWTAGDAIPAETYYKHSKLVFEGMARNVTYQFDEIVDCPQEYVLPEIEDDGHGAWFEIRLRHAGSFSSTLTVPEGVKVATEHTQAETAGFNMVDLHYQAIDGVKLWRFMNTHSSIPTT